MENQTRLRVGIVGCGYQGGILAQTIVSGDARIVACANPDQAAATAPMQKSFSGLMRCCAAGDPIDMREMLEAFPVKLTSVKEFAR
jgi:hypothetical protein